MSCFLQEHAHALEKHDSTVLLRISSQTKIIEFLVLDFLGSPLHRNHGKCGRHPYLGQYRPMVDESHDLISEERGHGLLLGGDDVVLRNGAVESLIRQANKHTVNQLPASS